MTLAYEDLQVLQAAEIIADGVWKEVTGWNAFARDALGQQLVRAADSVGANIAEAFGRYHFGDKLTFYYYARGSLFETKYWLNRAAARGLIDDAASRKYMAQLAEVARRLNAMAAQAKSRRAVQPAAAGSVKEPGPDYSSADQWLIDLFDQDDLAWLSS